MLCNRCYTHIGNFDFPIISLDNAATAKLNPFMPIFYRHLTANHFWRECDQINFARHFTHSSRDVIFSSGLCSPPSGHSPVFLLIGM
jgi:hypothetical protein